MPFLGKFQQVFQLTWSSQFFKSFRPQYRILTDANVTENLMQFQNRLITHVLFTPSGAISVPSNVIFLLKALETKCIFWKLCWFVSFLSRRDGNPHIPQNCRSRLNLTMTHDACGLCNSQQFKSFHIWVSTCSVVSELSWQSKPTFPLFRGNWRSRQNSPKYGVQDCEQTMCVFQKLLLMHDFVFYNNVSQQLS